MKKERNTKRFIDYAAGGCMFLLLCLFLSNCQDDLEFGFPMEGTLDVQTREMASTAELTKARAYYEQARKGTELLTRSLELEDTISKYSPYTPALNGDPSWLYYACNQNDTLLAVDVDVTDRIMQDYILQESWEGYQKYKQLKYRRSYTRYVYTRHLKTGKEQAFFMTIVPSLNCTRNYSTRIERNTYLYRNKYLSGYVLFHNMDGTFANGWEYKDGQIVGRVLHPVQARLLGVDMSKRLRLGKLPATYQVRPKLDKQTRIQTRSSGENIDGGWLDEWEVVGSGGGGGSDDGWDDDFGDWGDPFGDGDNTGDNTGDDGDPVIDSGDGNGGGGNSGGYEPPTPIIVIVDDELEKLYNFANSTLEQLQVNKLVPRLIDYKRGLVGKACVDALINSEPSIKIAFGINPNFTGESSARYIRTYQEIVFQSEEILSQFSPLNEEMCHAYQCLKFYDGKVNNSTANYEFEVKVLADLNGITSFLEEQGRPPLVGNMGYIDYDEFKDFGDEYEDFVGNLADNPRWDDETQKTFDELCKTWIQYHQHQGTSYGNMSFDDNINAEVLKYILNSK